MKKKERHLRCKCTQALALMLAAALLISGIQLPVSAEETGEKEAAAETSTVQTIETAATGLCEHHPEHTKDCGYADEIPGKDCNHTHTDECYKEVASCVHQHTEAICGFVAAVPASPCSFDPAACEECAKQDGEEEQAPVCAGLEGCADGAHASDCPLYEEPQPTCNCEAPCTEEAVNKDCPVCGAENADLGQCKGVVPVAALAVEPTEALTECPFTITKQDGSPATEDSGDVQGDYTWTTDTVNKLTIKNSDLTISTKESYTAVSPASAVIVVENDVTTLTLAGVNITAPISGGALNTTGALTINLAANSTNTLTGGNGGDSGDSGSSYGIYVAGALKIDGTGSLKATGGAAHGGGVSAGIFSNASITIDGGEVTATGGSSTGTDGTSFGIYAKKGSNESANPSITIKGGTVEATGGTGTNSYGLRATSSSISITGGNVTATGGSGSNKAGIGGNATFSTGTDGKAIIHASSIPNRTNEASWKGIIFEGNAGKVYGEQTLGENFTIAGGETLTVPDGAKLTVPSGKTLTIAQGGTLTVEQGGTLENNGTINNQGSIVNNGTIDNTNGTMTGNAPTGSGSVLPLPVTYTVTYDGNDNTSGAVPVDGTSYNSGAQVTVLGNTGNLEKTGYTFDGWNTAANGTGTTYAVGATFTISGNTILYAQWKANGGNPGGGDTDNSGTGGNGGGNQGGSNQDNDKPTKPVQPDKPEKPVVPPVIPTEPNPAEPKPVQPKPTQPNKPVQPTKPDTPADEEEPFIKGDGGNGNTDTGSGWTVITDQTEDAKDGDTVVVDMNGAVTVPGSVIESIAGKDVTVVFDMGEGILWTVNGLSVTAENIKDIKLSISRDTGGIPIDVINNVTGERYSMNISLDYDGEFGFTATLTINMEKKNAGLYANLFYYNPDAEAESGSDAADTDAKGALEFMCADEIDADGNADLEFTHASDYTIVIDEASMDPMLAEADTEDGSDAASADADAADGTFTETGADAADSTGISGGNLWVVTAIIVILALAGIAGYVYFMSRKNEDNDLE